MMSGKYLFEILFERVGEIIFGVLVILFYFLDLKSLSLVCFSLMLYCVSSYRFYKILNEIDSVKQKNCEWPDGPKYDKCRKNHKLED
jgi:hypothetical protein